MSDKKDILVTLLQEVRQDQKSHSTILVELQKDVAINTKDLTDHKEGVIQNRARIEKLEEPTLAFGIIKKYVIGLGTIAGAVYGILKLLDYL